LSRTLAAATLIAAPAFFSDASAGQIPRVPTYWIQLDDVSVESTRSRRTDTNYAALSVQADAGEARTTTKRLGDVGRGTKAVNMSLSRLRAPLAGRLRITWAVINYGGTRPDELTGLLKKAVEQQVAKSIDGDWLSQLSEAVSRALEEEGRAPSCDGPVLAGSLEISGADLARQTAQRKPLRVTRRQVGLEAPAKCAKKSDYIATLLIRRESAPVR
jgi:hypothetical protein